MLDSPRPPLRLAFPDTLPDHGRPGDPELINRQFLEPSRETNIRRQYFNALLERIKVPIAVRVVGVQESGATTPIDINGRLKKLGIHWPAFADGRREVLLDRLEKFAGKGAARSSPTSSPRMPITQIDLTSPPKPRASSSTIIDQPNEEPPFPIPQTVHHSSLAPARFPKAYQTSYRELLSNFPILTIDLSRTAPPNEWLGIQFSAWSTNGPAYYHPADPTDDVPFLSESEEDANNAVFAFPSFDFRHSIEKPQGDAPPEEKKAVLTARKEAKAAAFQAEAERRIKIVAERMVKKGWTMEQIEWEMQGKWDAQEQT